MSIPSSLLTVTLNGVEYAINPAVDEQNYVQGPQPQFPAADAELFWKTWTQTAFHQGERRKHILSEDDLDAYRYDDGEGIDVANLAEFGEVKLQPALTQVWGVKSATMPMAVSSDGTTLLVGLTAAPWVKIWTSTGGWASATSGLSAAVTDIIAVGSTFYAVTGGAVVTSTNGGAAWSAVGSYTGVSGIAYANGDLYVLHSASGTGALHNHTQAPANEATGHVSTIGGTVIAGYKENVYWGQDSRLYLYNGRSVTLYDKLPDGFNVTALISYRTILFILGYMKVRTGYKGAVYYIIQGSENHLYSLGNYAADHRIYALAGDFDGTWFASPKRGGADYYSLSEGGLSSGPATGTAMYIPFKSMAVCEGYLWVGRYDNVGTTGTAQATGNDTTHTKLAAGASASNDAYNGMTLWFIGGTGIEQSALISDYDGSTKIATHATVASAADDTTIYSIGTDGIYRSDIANPSAWRASGYLTTSEYDFGYGNVQKLLRDVRVEHRALVTGQSIAVAYSLDGGANWTTALTSNTVGATSKAATLSNIKAESVKLKATLASGGTNTPTLLKLITRAAPVSEAKLLWQIKTIAIKKFGGKGLITDIRTAHAAAAQLAFIDVDDLTYNVIVQDYKVLLSADPKRDYFHLLITLREV